MIGHGDLLPVVGGAAPVGIATVSLVRRRLTLAATLEGVGTVDRSMKIDVYDDACEMAKAVGTVEPDETDIVGDDCITNLKDFAFYLLCNNLFLQYL